MHNATRFHVVDLDGTTLLDERVATLE